MLMLLLCCWRPLDSERPAMPEVQAEEGQRGPLCVAIVERCEGWKSFFRVSSE